MFGLKKKDRVVSIELMDFYIRALVVVDGDLSKAVLHEYPLPPGMVEDEIVRDEIAFYDVIKELVKEWKIAKFDVRFFVPDQAVLMRNFSHPKELHANRIVEYVEMELGEKIHLPFTNPLIDVYDEDPDDGEAILFATPSEDTISLMHVYEDVQLEPTVLDIRALCNLRLLNYVQAFHKGKTYLVAEWTVNAVSISIYSNNNVDFLRYQPIENSAENWRYFMNDQEENVYMYEGNIADYHTPLIDQAFELERILNFYRFSLHKGEKAVDEIIIVGDNPEMEFISSQVRSVIDIPVTVIDDAFVAQYFPTFGAKHLSLLGLALKGVDPL